jgi:hypothetical protein
MIAEWVRCSQKIYGIASDPSWRTQGHVTTGFLSFVAATVAMEVGIT